MGGASRGVQCRVCSSFLPVATQYNIVIKVPLLVLKLLELFFPCRILEL